MAEQTGEGVPVFALGHSERGFDEARFAAETARHFKADYHELILDEDQLDEGLQLVSAGFDEPLGDASIIPSHLLARFARQHVKVILSGEGGDESVRRIPDLPRRPRGSRAAAHAAGVAARDVGIVPTRPDDNG